MGQNAKNSQKLAENTKRKKEEEEKKSILLNRDGPKILSVDATKEWSRKSGNSAYKMWHTL